MLCLTLTVNIVPVAATLNSSLSTVNMMSAALWTTLTIAVALPSVATMVIVAVREVATAFVSVVTVSCESPSPFVELSFNQDALGAAVHAVLDLMVIDLDSALALKVSSPGAADIEASAPACLTVTVMLSLWSLRKTMEPLRASVPSLASDSNTYVSTSSLATLLTCLTQSCCESTL